MEPLHKWTRFIVTLSILTSVVVGAGFFVLVSQTQSVLTRFSQFVSNVYGLWGVIVAVAAVGIWIIRKIFIEVKRRQIPDYNITKATLLFLRKHHMLLGWATIVAVTAHALYYLLRFPNRQMQVYTGMIAFTFLVILAGIGVFLDYRIVKKRGQKGVRLYHQVLAVLFLVFMVIHVLS